jgi:flagellar basal body-associated protein FliL
MAVWSDEDVRVRGLAERARETRRGLGLAKALGVVAGVLALALIAGSVYGLVSGTRQKKLAREIEGAQLSAELRGRASFTGIGTVRAKSSDPKSAAVVVATIAFPYDAGDRPFAEELGRKAAVLRAAALSLLSSRKAAELGPAYEGSIKAGLRDAFNARLSLGKVSEVWLSDFALIQ